MLFHKLGRMDTALSMAERCWLWGCFLLGAPVGAFMGIVSPFVDALGKPLAIIAGVTFVLAFIYVAIHTVAAIRRRTQPKALKDVVRERFRNQTVQLDGHNYVDCVFDACTLEFHGGDFALDNSAIAEDCRIGFRSRESIAAVRLMYHFSLFQDPRHRVLLSDRHGRIINSGEIFTNELKGSDKNRKAPGVHPGEDKSERP